MTPENFVQYLDALRAENAKQAVEITRLTAQLRLRCGLIQDLQAQLAGRQHGTPA